MVISEWRCCWSLFGCYFGDSFRCECMGLSSVCMHYACMCVCVWGMSFSSSINVTNMAKHWVSCVFFFVFMFRNDSIVRACEICKKYPIRNIKKVLISVLFNSAQKLNTLYIHLSASAQINRWISYSFDIECDHWLLIHLHKHSFACVCRILMANGWVKGSRIIVSFIEWFSQK